MNNKRIIGVSIGIGLIVIAAGVFLRSFGEDVLRLEMVSPMQTVELKNGDSYDLTASVVKKTINGATIRMLAYNGSIPGPLIKVAQGAEVTINVKNETDIGTTIHSHGVRLENTFDGVPDETQPLIPPGGSFTYKVTFPDAGMYWYHPHFREDYAQELGLYGGYLVAPQNADYWRPVNREVPLFLDDLLVENGQVRVSRAGADHTLMGRYGNVMLVNGETNYSLNVQKGEVVRFYVVNVANARPFRFAIRNTKMKLVGADSGATEREMWQDGVTLGPSERAVVEALFDKPGTFAIQHTMPGKTATLGSITVSETPVSLSYAADFENLRTHAETVASIDPFRSAFDGAPTKRLTLTLDMGGNMMGMNRGGHMMPDGTMMGGGMMQASPDGIEWEDENAAMNAMSNTDTVTWKLVDEDTGKENMDIDWSFERGKPVKIRIFNDPKSMHPMQHPIHFHGQRFLVLARDGVKETNLVWKDTVLIPSGQTVDILLDPSNPGIWMAHCHIAEHLEAGMMLMYKVE
ncbi:MAG: hypothetical protein RL141_985 [Candidatus Parcubacteria bacterium]|jgi:FtsP/CotA-like multicopper oxidase with cupredoxin domain